MRQLSPGSPFPLGAMWDGQGTNFSLFSGARRARRALPVRRRRQRGAPRAARAHRAQLARLPARASGRASATATGCTGPGRPSRVTASTRTSCCSTRTRRRSTGRSTGTRATRCRTRRTAATTSTSSSTSEDDARAMPKCVVIDESFDWEDDDVLRPRIPWHETVIYEVHTKGFTDRHPTVRDDLRGTYAGLASDGGARAPAEPRRHVRRAAADPPHRRRELPPRQGPHELLGLLDDRLPRAARALRGDRARAASRCASSRAW